MQTLKIEIDFDSEEQAKDFQKAFEEKFANDTESKEKERRVTISEKKE